MKDCVEGTREKYYKAANEEIIFCSQTKVAILIEIRKPQTWDAEMEAYKTYLLLKLDLMQ